MDLGPQIERSRSAQADLEAAMTAIEADDGEPTWPQEKDNCVTCHAGLDESWTCSKRPMLRSNGSSTRGSGSTLPTGVSEKEGGNSGARLGVFASRGERPSSPAGDLVPGARLSPLALANAVRTSKR
jgi:hypothetical protein